MQPNHYELLKVQPDAPIAVIRAAYRALAAQHHPDRQVSQVAEPSHHEMARINAAYEVLIDPQRRAQYDALLSEVLPAAMTRPVSRGPQRAAAPAEDTGPATRVDIAWMDAEPAPERQLPPRRWMALAAGSMLSALAGGLWFSHQAHLRAEAEQAVATRLHSPLQDAASGAAPSPMESQSVNFLVGSNAHAQTEVPTEAPAASPASLAREQTVESVTVASEPLPSPAAPPRRPAEHLLDGSPLRLRPDPALPADLPGGDSAGLR